MTTLNDHARRWILISAIALLCLQWAWRAVTLEQPVIRANHERVLNRTEATPGRERILTPLVAQGITTLIPAPIEAGVVIAHIAMGCAALSAWIALTYRWLRRFAPGELALSACLFLCVATPTTFYHYVGVPYSYVEAAIFMWGVDWCYRAFCMHSW